MFYTYLWLREDGTPYYVGKGKENRAFTSLGHRVKCPPKERIVIYPAESEVEAFESEVALIWYYGRKNLGTGCLRNLTDGGEGQSGRVVPEEERKRRGAKLKGHTTSKETRRKISLANKGRPNANAGKVGVANHMFGKHTSEKQKEAVRKAGIGNTHAAGSKNHVVPHSEETKSTISSKVKSLWADPEYREHMVQVHKGQGKGRKHSAETKSLIRLHHNPESNKNLEKRHAV